MDKGDIRFSRFKLISSEAGKNIKKEINRRSTSGMSEIKVDFQLSKYCLNNESFSNRQFK